MNHSDSSKTHKNMKLFLRFKIKNDKSISLVRYLRGILKMRIKSHE